MKEKQGYFAILTADVRYDKNLSASEKLMFAEITCLTNATGRCFASNAYFAELYDVARSTVSLWISNLAKSGHIDIEYEYNGKEVHKRFISIKNPSGIHAITNGQSPSEIADKVVRKSEGGGQKIRRGWSENQKDNRTLTESNINTNTYSQDFEDAWKAYGGHGGKKKSYSIWKKLSKEEREKASQAIPAYLESIDPAYKKYFEGYLNSGLFESNFKKRITVGTIHQPESKPSYHKEML
jgi:hypothetical protein